jgi:hypothetical protein
MKTIKWEETVCTYNKIIIIKPFVLIKSLSLKRLACKFHRNAIRPFNHLTNIRPLKTFKISVKILTGERVVALLGRTTPSCLTMELTMGASNRHKATMLMSKMVGLRELFSMFKYIKSWMVKVVLLTLLSQVRSMKSAISFLISKEFVQTVVGYLGEKQCWSVIVAAKMLNILSISPR